ncbi:hypothetical protein [uncultured Brachyspira sp.]|uniref:hypothetical protein n=1 Tax=uncultured Brachyspira sp. TaxID=221953 RepID=UPI00263A0C5F|nr:hypothetical protein [uncultured Brachyspira sp.]
MSLTEEQFNNIARFLYALSRLAIEIKRGNFYKQQYEIFLANWKDTDFENIFKTGGQNIQNPMRAKKNNPNLLGIWTGETRYALLRGMKVGNKIDVFKRISNKKIQYGYKAKYKSKDITKYINVNLGISKEFLDSEAKRIANVIEDLFGDIVKEYSL